MIIKTRLWNHLSALFHDNECAGNSTASHQVKEDLVILKHRYTRQPRPINQRATGKLLIYILYIYNTNYRLSHGLTISLEVPAESFRSSNFWCCCAVLFIEVLDVWVEWFEEANPTQAVVPCSCLTVSMYFLARKSVLCDSILASKAAAALRRVEQSRWCSLNSLRVCCSEFPSK